MLVPHPIPKLEDHLLSAVRNCVFNIFAATIHICRRSSLSSTEDMPCQPCRAARNTGCSRETNKSGCETPWCGVLVKFVPSTLLILVTLHRLYWCHKSRLRSAVAWKLRYLACLTLRQILSGVSNSWCQMLLCVGVCPFLRQAVI